METLGSLRSPQGGCSNCVSNRVSFFTGSAKSTLASVPVRHENGERRRSGLLSVQAKGRKNMMPGRTPPAKMPNIPNLDDDDNPKFVIFIRTLNVPRWYPLSIVSGGTTAKVMLAAMGNQWGKKLYGSTLTRNMASVVYKDERAIKQTAFKTYPVLKSATGFQYGYKIVDKSNPRSAFFASDVIEIPPEGELVSLFDKVKKGFSDIASGVKETFGSISPIEPEVEAESEPESAKKSKKKAK